MPDIDLISAFHRHRDQLEDFWARRLTRPRFSREFYVFGRAVRLCSNDESALAVADYALPQYSTAAVAAAPPFVVQLAVRPARLDPGPAPDDLMQQITYTGDGAWLLIHLGAWGQAHVDLERGVATAALAPQLADRPELVGQVLLNTILTNFCIGNGFAMLHASCLHRDGRTLLLMAPHNTGKSTTALRLILAGYPLVSDSMIFVSPHDGRLNGFPVGRIKLRADMAPLFPRLQPFLAAEKVRQETKYTLDLRRLEPDLVWETAVAPAAVELCLLGRSDEAQSELRPAAASAVGAAVIANSQFYDSTAVWERNLSLLQPLIGRARHHHLTIGRDPESIVTTVAQLWH